MSGFLLLGSISLTSPVSFWTHAVIVPSRPTQIGPTRPAAHATEPPATRSPHAISATIKLLFIANPPTIPYNPTA